MRLELPADQLFEATDHFPPRAIAERGRLLGRPHDVHEDRREHHSTDLVSHVRCSKSSVAALDRLLRVVVAVAWSQLSQGVGAGPQPDPFRPEVPVARHRPYRGAHNGGGGSPHDVIRPSPEEVPPVRPTDRDRGGSGFGQPGQGAVELNIGGRSENLIDASRELIEREAALAEGHVQAFHGLVALGRRDPDGLDVPLLGVGGRHRQESRAPQLGGSRRFGVSTSHDGQSAWAAASVHCASVDSWAL